MLNIKWDRKFELGHERIDSEHRIFLNLIKAVSSETERERIVRLLQEVEKYAEFHFISEENLMIDIQFPEFQQHQQEHMQLLAALRNMIFDYQQQNARCEELTEFLFEWFALHTTQIDIRLVEYIRQQNVS